MSFEISASGLKAQRIRMNVIANNIANANTTRTTEGVPYRKRSVLFASIGSDVSDFASTLRRTQDELSGGVKVVRIIEDRSATAFIPVYDPSHPDADEAGIVLKPNIPVVREMVDLIDASRAFEANVTAFNATKDMQQRVLNMGR